MGKLQNEKTERRKQETHVAVLRVLQNKR